MSILERIRATDRMLEVVDELSRHMGMKDGTEFQKRIAADDQAAELSPLSHPPMRRVLASFEPCWLGGATGRGAEPST